LQAESDNNLYFVDQRKILNMKDGGRVTYEKITKNYKDLKKAN
jgi:hypothetical protein